jgi:hypothetical protein
MGKYSDTYPVTLIPQPLKQVQNVLPPVPSFEESEPLAPGEEPQPLNGSVIALEVTGLILSSFFMAALGGGLAFLWFCLGAILIGFQVVDEKKSYPQRHQAWLQRVNNYEQKTELYHQRRQEHELKVEAARKPERILAYRLQLMRQVLSQTIPHNGDNSRAQQGQSEARFGRFLKKYFSGKIYAGLTLFIPGYEYPYTPDFAYINSSIGLFIDIEIDEPYVYTTGQETHCLNCWKEQRRNNFFLDKGWLVVRFAEEQVVQWPLSCCKVIANTINRVTGETIPAELANEPHLPSIDRWTEEEARNMADENFRDSYLRDSYLS